MYNALSVIVSILALGAASSSALFIAGNNRNIDSMRANADKANEQIIANNQLTKKQILALINNVNENDAKILKEHRGIKTSMNRVEKESKLRTENVDTRFRGFKNITNANVVGITDRVRTNDELINKRTDVLNNKFDQYKVFNDAKIGEIKFNHSNLDDRHGMLTNDFNTFKSGTTSKLQENRNHAAKLNKNTLDFIDTKFQSFVSDSVQMDDKAAAVLDNIRDITSKKLGTVESDYKRQDENIKTTIRNNDNIYKQSFMRTDDLENKMNERYFDDKPDFNNMNSLIAQTSANKNNISSYGRRLDDNDSKINTIREEYLKVTEIPQKINQAMSSTDIYRDVKNNEDDINRVDKKLITNVESINRNNEELKDMLKSFTGGLNGEISLNDLNERIQENAKKIDGNTVKTKMEILRTVKEENAVTNKKITENSIKISGKVGNTKDEYAKAFNEHVSDDDLVKKMKDAKVDLSSVTAETAEFEKDLTVQGVKFSSLLNDLKMNGLTSQRTTGSVPIYSKDFQSDSHISPNKSVRFKPDQILEMNDGKMNLRRGELNMQNGVMNLNDTDFNWKRLGNEVNLNGAGLNLNSTKVNVNNFKNIKDSDDNNLSEFIDQQILKSQSSSDSGIGGQVEKYIKNTEGGIKPQSVTTPYLFIGDPNNKINVKQEIDSVKTNIKNFMAISGAQQNSKFFNKQDPSDLHEEVRKDMRANPDKYIKTLSGVNTISAETVNAEKINLKADTLNNIKFNGTPLSEALDKRYAQASAVSDALNDPSLRKTVSGISMDKANNVLEVTFSDPQLAKQIVELPKSQVAVMGVTVEGNDLVLSYASGARTKVPLPKVDLSNVASKELLERDYAKKKSADGEDKTLVYLDPVSKDRLQAIVQDDQIRDLKSFDSGDVTDLRKSIVSNTIKLQQMEANNKKYDMMESKVKADISLDTINRNSLNNKSAEFIRLNDNVALRAKGNRLQMCTNLKGADPGFEGYDDEENCFDFWTTKDFGEDDEIKVNQSDKNTPNVKTGTWGEP